MSNRYVASGFRQDMEELFSLFLTPEKEPTDEILTDEKKTSLRFSRFSCFWRQMNFSLVFRHRLHENDLREFVEEVFLIVLPNVCSEYAYERRVCALYFLYSLFLKQPKTINQKIRINFLYMDQIRDLIQKSKQLEQLEVCYIWHKLWSLGAVDLVVASRQVGPNFIRSNRSTTGKESKTDFLVNQFKASIYPPFNELSNIHDKYCTVKKVLSKENPGIQKECHVIEENIFQKSKSMADQMLKSATDMSIISMDTSESQQINGSDDSIETNENTAPDIGSKRLQLKEKSANCVTHAVDKQRASKILRRYGPITQHEIQTENRKKGKGKRGRPKVAKWTNNQL